MLDLSSLLISLWINRSWIIGFKWVPSWFPACKASHLSPNRWKTVYVANSKSTKDSSPSQIHRRSKNSPYRLLLLPSPPSRKQRNRPYWWMLKEKWALTRFSRGPVTMWESLTAFTWITFRNKEKGSRTLPISIRPGSPKRLKQLGNGTDDFTSIFHLSLSDIFHYLSNKD